MWVTGLTDPHASGPGRLHQLRWIPNALTFLRIVLVVPFAVALLREHHQLALLIFLTAAVTDGLDGFLARVCRWKSRIGAIADPLADKLLLVTAWFMFSMTGLVPWWLFILVLARDLVIVVGGLMFHRLVSSFEVEPSLFGKLNTLVQISGALLIMLSQAGWVLPEETLGAVIAVVAVSALISGGHYAWVWGRKARLGRFH